MLELFDYREPVGCKQRAEFANGEVASPPAQFRFLAVMNDTHSTGAQHAPKFIHVSSRISRVYVNENIERPNRVHGLLGDSIQVVAVRREETRIAGTAKLFAADIHALLRDIHADERPGHR